MSDELKAPLSSVPVPPEKPQLVRLVASVPAACTVSMAEPCAICLTRVLALRFDLLPDRESETLKKWLEAHPGVEIVSRDRAGAYAEGARKGAPGALQVADRFHILCNLTQVLQRLLERLGAAIRRSQISKSAPSANATSGGVPTEPSATTTTATTPGSSPYSVL